MDLPNDLNSLIGKHVYWIGSYFEEGEITKLELIPGINNSMVWLNNNVDKNQFKLLSQIHFNKESAYHAALGNEEYWRYVAIQLKKDLYE